MDIIWKPGQSLMKPVTELSQVGEARRAAAALATRLSFTSARASDLAIIMTELARNMIMHGGGGKLILHPFNIPDVCEGLIPSGDDAETEAPMAGIDILALDTGPGMEDLERCMQDGYSTRGTPGNGMGALKRLADKIDIYTTPGHGTAVLCRCFANGPTTRYVQKSPYRPAIGAINVAKPGQKHCGDHWACRRTDRGLQLVVADGLGHGPEAEAASHAFTAMFRDSDLPPAQLFQQAHLALLRTRGAAVALAHIHPSHRQIDHWCVGNIAGSIIASDRVDSMIGQHGTVGLAMPDVRPTPYIVERNAVLVLTSDGIKSRWSLEHQPGLLTHDPTLVAGIVYRDHTRGNDDATVVVMQLFPQFRATQADRPRL